MERTHGAIEQPSRRIFLFAKFSVKKQRNGRKLLFVFLQATYIYLIKKVYAVSIKGILEERGRLVIVLGEPVSLL